MECVQRERSDSRSIETGVCVSHSLFHCPPASHTHPRTRSRRMQKNGSINHKNPPFFHASREDVRFTRSLSLTEACLARNGVDCQFTRWNSVCQSRKDHTTPSTRHSRSSPFPSVCTRLRSFRSRCRNEWCNECPRLRWRSECKGPTPKVQH